MVFLTISEVIDIFIMTVFVGFIFSDIIKKPAGDLFDSEGVLIKQSRWSWDNLKFSAMITAPAVLFHEFGHKIVAMSFGLQATFNAAYTWLGLGLVLKLVGFPFVFFVPAYVKIIGATSPLNYSLIAFAGPAVNLIMWLTAWGILEYIKRTDKSISKNARVALLLTKQINMFLFIFNMLPIPGFDGFKVFSGILQAL